MRLKSWFLACAAFRFGPVYQASLINERSLFGIGEQGPASILSLDTANSGPGLNREMALSIKRRWREYALEMVAGTPVPQ